METTNAFLLCRLGERIFFYTSKEAASKEKPYFIWKDGKACDVVVLSESEADRVFRFGNRLYITEHKDDCLIERNGKLYLITKAEKTVLTVLEETGEPRRLTVEAADGRAEDGRVEVTASFELVREEANEAGERPEYREYAVHISSASCPAKEQLSPACHQLYLEADYVGDRAEVWLDGKLVDDWFTNGEKWHIALKRFAYPSSLTLRIYSTDCPIPNPYGNRVYYDLPVKEGCELTGVRGIPEYEIPVRENAE